MAGSRAAGPHAVCSVGSGPQFAYDGDGNLTSDGSRSVTYNPSNKVTGIEGGGSSVAFMYGADGNRVVQTVTSGGATTRTVYVGLGATGKSLFEQTATLGGPQKNVHYIYAGGVHGGNAFAIRVLDAGGAPAGSQYYNFDNLGSVTAMSDDSGRVTTAESGGASATVFGYDPWGARRNPDGTVADPASFTLPTGGREFTGQEQIPDVGLVNMNGRVYDPVLGRFLSPDPNVQFVANLQSYNRYTYVNNNPLSYTDPTGYSTLGDIGHWLSSTFGNPFTDFEIGLSLVACLGSAGVVAVGCGIAVGLTIAAINASIAVASGAGFEQTVALTGIGLGVGMVTGAAAGGGLTGLIVGSASAAVTTGISNVAAGRSFLGYDMLGAAFLSAAQGAAAMGLNKVIEVSQANIGAHYAADPQGDPNDLLLKAIKEKSIDLPDKVLEALPKPKGHDGAPPNYRLTDAAIKALTPAFEGTGIDLRDIVIGPGYVPSGYHGYTFLNGVTMDSDFFNNEDARQQLIDLTHEITHTVQYRLDGVFGFLSRYSDEASSLGLERYVAQPGVVPRSYLDPNFTLDQIANYRAAQLGAALK